MAMPAHLIIWIVIAVFYIFLMAWFFRVSRRSVVSFDGLGLTTKNGKYYLWNDLEKVRYLVTLPKLDKNAPKKIHSLILFFTNGEARLNYLVKDSEVMIKKINGMKIPSTEKVIGYYRK